MQRLWYVGGLGARNQVVCPLPDCLRRLGLNGAQRMLGAEIDVHPAEGGIANVLLIVV